MADRGARYTPAFMRQMVEPVSAGRTPASLAKELGPSVWTIALWVNGKVPRLNWRNYSFGSEETQLTSSGSTRRQSSLAFLRLINDATFVSDHSWRYTQMRTKLHVGLVRAVISHVICYVINQNSSPDNHRFIKLR